MKPKHQTDVLVVGAGPVGLCTALALAEDGIEVQVVDRDWIGSAHSYALALHPATLAMLDAMELSDDLAARGRRISRLGLYEGESLRGAVDFGRLGGLFSHLLVLPQSKLEGAMEERLTDRGVRVLWNHQVLGFEQDDDGVRCDIGRLDRVSLGYPIARSEWIVDRRFETRARYVVGADGYASFTRRSIEARFEDHGGAESFAVYEFEPDDDPGDEMRVVFHDDRLAVLWPMADGRARWSFQIEPEGDEGPAGPPDLGRLLAERAPWFPAPREIYWSTRTRFERRLAEPFGRERTWLAGDAAHVTGPVGAQSMNVGLLEARDLADRLASLVARGGSPKLLEIYAAERRAEWRRLLGLEGAPRAVDGAPPWIGDRAARILPCLPGSGEALRSMLGQLGLEWS